jgi:leucyl-tRNA synthetase|tara:strand:+ start:1390 stop:1587 length:198 start_codon:yes stop_codon:yes gene_type:complete
MWRACNGDVPTKPKELMARIPEIATSLRTAEKLSKDLKTARTLMNNTVRKVANNWIYKWLITRGC